MDSASRPPSPDFPPSSQQKPLKHMPQRATPLRGQAWVRVPPQSVPITPSPPTPPKREDGKLPSPPQLGWAKRTAIVSSKSTETADALVSAEQQESSEVSPNRSPTPVAAGTTAVLEHETYLALIAAQQLIANDDMGDRGGPAMPAQDAGPMRGDERAESWHQASADFGQEPFNYPVDQFDDGARPARKRQRTDSSEIVQDNAHAAGHAWQLEDPLAPPVCPTQAVGDTPPPYDTIPTRARAAAPLGLAPTPRAMAAPLQDPKGKGKAFDPAGPAAATSEHVLISVDELARLRSLALQNDTDASSFGADVFGRSNERHNYETTSIKSAGHDEGIPQPIDLRTALRHPSSGQASPANAFPLTVDFNDPEQRRLLRELLLGRERAMLGMRTRTDEMDVDVAGEHDAQPPMLPLHTPLPVEGPPHSTPRASGPSTTRLLWEIAEPSTAPADAQPEQDVIGLGLSVPPMGEAGRFPAVHTRSPNDRVRGIPQEALDEFSKLPRATKMVLEVYGKAQVDRAEATKITREIEKIIRAATGLDVFALTPPPRPSPGTPPSETPTAWLLTGITPAASDILARRHGWATPDVAFFAYHHPEPIPTYLFALEGFNQNNANTAAAIVREEFRREPTFTTIRNLVAANAALNGDVKGAMDRILMSVRVVLRREGPSEDDPSLGHVYMDPPTLSADLWTAWRDGLLTKKFSRTLYSLDYCKESIRCDRCHAADHRTTQCEYMHLGDWHGTFTPAQPSPPTPPPITEAREDLAPRGSRGGGRGSFRGAGGGGQGQWRGASVRGRGGKKFAQGTVPRGG
ncbi:hypothetical protein OH77DRAFT_1432205 [Trametes cingulata]|nr:hypothetical protein OH77DRAFT_1432205 [Trametes cingulata]